MPIDIETFEDESGFEDDTNAERIVRFLAVNDDKAFRRSEIAAATDIDPDAASAVLSRLKQRELVRHKPPYWAIGTEQRVRSATDVANTLESLNDRLGEEEMDEWRAASEDSSDQ